MIVKSAMVGLGSVARNLFKIIKDKEDRLRSEYGIEFRFICLADSQGSAVNIAGFDINEVLQIKSGGGSVKDLAGFVPETAIKELVGTLELDLVFEASPVDLQTGGLGLAVARTALSKGISVVFANKGPVVKAFRELEELALQSGAGLRFSATVCGGLPIINIGRRDMIAAEIIKFYGIFNSTTNFIIDEMGGGRSYKDALTETQRRGIAETDPSLDVGGWDTANKLVIIANSVLKSDITLADVRVTGITDITTEDIRREKLRGNAVRLVASFENGNFDVQPKPVPETSFIGQCSGWEMGIELHSDIYGIMYLKLWERESIPTAASMVRDAVDIFRGYSSPKWNPTKEGA